MNLKEIEARIAEIKNELETRGTELSVEESNKLVDEAEQLNEQRKALVEAAEKRNAALENIAAGEGKTVRTFAAPNGAEFNATSICPLRSFRNDDELPVKNRVFSEYFLASNETNIKMFKYNEEGDIIYIYDINFEDK